ncbi:MAG: nucleoside hydrolase [Saprospiraceae bacterium]|nr:nucleoside hydrolase [Saprospiraceae bacterium]
MTKIPVPSCAFFLLLLLGFSCNNSTSTTETEAPQEEPTSLIPVIFDTDANNELDDQHAMAYLLFNGKTFDVKGITVNATRSGGNIDEQHKEAERILKLCQLDGKIPLYKGADQDFLTIEEDLSNAEHDGAAAVDFIIAEAKKMQDEPLVLLAVGKLTNVALALAKAPEIKEKIRVVWLGSNYPDPGEYNQENDTASMSYVLQKNVPFEMVTVRYGKPSGTDAVQVTQEEVMQKMPGKGPRIATPITGRHGGTYFTFGDYAVNLFEHIEYHVDPPARALYDMAAVAIVKSSDWAEKTLIPCPVLVDGKWKDQPENDRKIILWENFNKTAIIQDFYQTLDHIDPVAGK